jgi:hypothetical protein
MQMLLFDWQPATPNTKAVDIVAKLAKADTSIPVEPPKPRKRKSKSLAERFWAKVDKQSDPDGCWLWTGGLMSSGYGNAWGEGRMVGAHRIAFELLNNTKLKPGERVLHADGCSKLCCRHLRRGTQQENIAEAGRAGAIKRKLTAVLAREVVKLHDGGKGLKVPALSAQFGVSPQSIQHILKGRAWAHATGLAPTGKAAQAAQRKAAKAAQSAKVEKRVRPRKGPKHLELGAVA